VNTNRLADAARARNSNIARTASAVRYWVTPSQMKNVRSPAL
jgi:hypothetical protein